MLLIVAAGLFSLSGAAAAKAPEPVAENV
jgi:hypothetical protein